MFTNGISQSPNDTRVLEALEARAREKGQLNPLTPREFDSGSLKEGNDPLRKVFRVSQNTVPGLLERYLFVPRGSRGRGRIGHDSFSPQTPQEGF